MSKLPVGRKTPVAAALAVILSTLLLGSLAYGNASNSLQVSYIDVGQGDSILLHASDNTDILIDGGPRSAGPTVVAYLQSEAIDDIEVMVLTHADADHVGGLIDVLRSTIPVGSVIYNGQPGTTLTYQEFITETMARGLTPTPAQAGQMYAWGAISTTILNPQAVPAGNQNDDSVVMLIVYGDVRFLFPGDISSTTEQVILGLGMPVAADVLKVAHHGSQYSSSASFLDAVGAELAIISVGASNPYGHPAQETLNRLQATGARVLRTDQNGTIVVTTDGLAYQVEADFIVFLPLVLRAVPTPTPTNTPTPTPTPTGTPTPTPTPTNTPPSVPQITCWVSDPNPSQYTTVTVYGRLTQDSIGLAGVPMTAEWHYKTTTSYCYGTSGSDGTASCSRYISGATPGYTVYIYVTMTYGGQGYNCTTWFTPHS